MNPQVRPPVIMDVDVLRHFRTGFKPH
jgi:hypothetical protein